MLLHARGWTALVVLSLGLGIGANAALFSAVNGMLLTKIPARDPDTLVRLRWAGRCDRGGKYFLLGPRQCAVRLGGGRAVAPGTSPSPLGLGN